MRTVSVLALAGVLASTAPFMAPLTAQTPAALVIRVQGDVDVTHGASAPAPASVGERMFVGDGVIPSSGSRAVLITRAGAQQIVTQRATIAESSEAGNPDIFE